MLSLRSPSESLVARGVARLLIAALLLALAPAEAWAHAPRRALPRVPPPPPSLALRACAPILARVHLVWVVVWRTEPLDPTQDDMGRLIKTTYPDLTTDESTYDPEGRRLTGKDRENRITSYLYDDLGRLLKTTLPDLTFTENVYDPAGRLSATKDVSVRRTTS